LKHIDLFSGIGGFALAAKWMNWETICFCEKEPFCQKLLAQNFPNTPIWDDITTLKGEWIKQYINESNDDIILTGGFPCQPASHSGKRLGTKDTRWLWQEQLRVVQEIRPRFIIGENVTGILSLEDGKPFERICTSLEDEGYNVQPFVLPACSKGTEHKRERVFILAYATCIGLQESLEGLKQNSYSCTKAPNLINSLDFITRNVIERNSGDLRTGDGLPNWMDRIKGLGNAVVPQLIFELYKIIQYYADTSK